MGKLNIVVLGDGLLGSEIVKQTNWDCLSRKKDNIDFTDVNSYFDLLKNYKVILNCIACTDTYSDNKDLHYNVNYKYVVKLARYCEIHNKKLIHISSDYVYSNNTNTPSETDVPHYADNWYSYTKLLGDNAVQVESDNNLVIRCTHKPTPFPYNKAWVDQVGNFDYVDIISSLIIKAINKQFTGLYNIGTDVKSMYDLAAQTAEVEKINAPSEVPKNLSMSIDKFNRDINKPVLTIAIPTYGYNGNGGDFLRESFQKLYQQTFKDFNIVISDHSRDNTIKNICEEWSNKLTINYYVNEHGRGNIAANLNNCLKYSNGRYIKILFQDDFLYTKHSLGYLVSGFNSKTHWLVNACEHSHDGKTYFRPFQPHYNHNIHQGENTLSCPSSLTIKNTEDNLLFDENLNWLMDCDYYKRLYNRYGLPDIVTDIVTVNRIHFNQLSETMTLDEKNAEYSIIRKKFA